MTDSLKGLRFEQLHIDVARNATDDFNPFHDPRRWQRIRANPFGSTIALGFQTAFVASSRIEPLHRGEGVAPQRDVNALPFSNYDFRFVGALRPGEPFDVELRETVDKLASGKGLSTRVVVRKADGSPVLIGTQSETVDIKYLGGDAPQALPALAELPDRALVPGTRCFLKRKFVTTSNGKNFIIAGLGRQQDYIDELDERVSFPPMFTAGLASCALLEQALQSGYDFETDPLVYASHQITVDRRLQAQLRSNDRLHLLVDGPRDDAAAPADRLTYHVYGLVFAEAVLFRARLQLARLVGG